MTGTTANYGFSYPQGTDLVTNGAAAIQTLAEGVDTALFNTPSSYRNLLINGGMDIYQRGNNPTFSFATSGTRTYSIDRWSNTWNSSMGSWAVTRSTTVPTGQGFGYSFKMDCTATTTSGTGRMMIVQAIEGQNLQHVRKGTTAAKQLTLSFWAYTTRTGGGTMIAELEDYTNSRFVSAAVTINAANTWEYKTVTFPADTTGTLANSNAAALGLNLWINAGSTYSGGASLQTTWGTTTNTRAVGCTNFADNTANDVYITGVQLEVGSVDTPFEFESFATTLRKCLRYYEKSYHVGTAPATANTGGAYVARVEERLADGAGTARFFAHVNFKEYKRSSTYTPAIYSQAGTLSRVTLNRAGNSGTAGYYNLYVAASADNAYNVSSVDIGEGAFILQAQTVWLPTLSFATFHWVADAEL